MPRFTSDTAAGRDWIFTYVSAAAVDTSNPDLYWTHDLDPVDAVFDPHNRRIYTRARQRASAWRENWDFDVEGDARCAIGDVAAVLNCTPGEALTAIAAGVNVMDYGRAPDHPAGRRLTFELFGWDRECDDDGDETWGWVDEIIPALCDPPGHEYGCDCNTCDPCDCEELHCERCHPEGPREAGCECDVCYPERQFDDQGDDDTWGGLPDMPVTPPGRCRFGIEIEFNGQGSSTRGSAMSLLQRNGFGVLDVGYTHEVSRYWKMTTDASVTGGELVSPVMCGDDASIEQVREAVRLVKQAGGITGRNVGMHVHLDVTEFRGNQLVALANNLERVEQFFAGFVPEHRYDGSNSCGADLFDEHEWGELRRWITNVNPAHRERTRDNRVNSCPIDRYKSFNFNSLLAYGTIECRLLGHTLNTVKIRTWIRTLQAFIEASRQERTIRRGSDVLAWLVEHGGLEESHADHFRTVVESRNNTEWLRAAA